MIMIFVKSLIEDQKIINYQYILPEVFGKAEYFAVQLPLNNINMKLPLCASSLKTDNKALYDLINDTEPYILRLWVPVFYPFEEIFVTQLYTSRKFREKIFNKIISEGSYINDMYLEYINWICYLKNHFVDLSYKKRDLYVFLLEYNNECLILPPMAKKMKTKLFLFNPFIRYWFNCRVLHKCLNIQKFIVFLPNINILKYLLKNEENLNSFHNK